ncbi:MAG TPA: tetratricopeptide repeat protein [Gemmatimonadales bacterium]|nr:tetratricopeptide repeat protein [Gemmatimonadales bacterium]
MTNDPDPRNELHQTAQASFAAAEAAWRESRYSDAAGEYGKALAAEPGFVEARIGHARALELAEDPEAALRSLDAALQASPDQTEYLVVRGALRGRLRRYPEAEADLRRVLKLHPAHAPAMHELGVVLMNRGLVGEAAELLHRAMTLQPDRAGIYVALGDALNRASQLPAAAEALAKATERNPSDRRAWHIYGRVLDRLNRPDEAAQAYRRAQGYDL